MRSRAADAMPRAQLIAVALAPGLLLFALHLRTLDYGFVWTDQTEIVERSLVLPAADLHEAFTQRRAAGAWDAGGWAYYRPLQVVVVSGIHAIAGQTPAVYRGVSLALGALTLGLFALLVLIWLRAPLPAVFAAALPALHPAGLEVWVWIAGLSASMATFGVIAGLACAVLWLRDESIPGRRWLLPGCLVSYGLALLSKESAVVLPALLLAHLLSEGLGARAESGRTLRIAGLELPIRGLALVAVLAGIGAFHLGVIRPAVLGPSSSAIAIGGSRVTHVLTALASWPGSLGWMLLPLSSNASDVVPIVDRISEPGPWLGLGLGAGSVVVWLLLARAGRSTAALGVAWIWIAFLPTANLLPMLHATAERNLFFPSFGLALVLADLGPALARRIRANGSAAGIAMGMLGLLLLAGLGQRTWARAPDWRSTESLFARDVARDPFYREGRYWLAGTLLREGRFEEAEPHLQILMTQVPDIRGQASYLGGDAWLLVCQARLLQGNPRAALDFVGELERSRPRRAERPSIRSCRDTARQRLRASSP
jgi:hypothetical protein